ncbi:MAG: helix-turn-helix domain-containing protein, partial [Anaeroplasmataceae bacterium]|nr:helix-turn-helix domain-containing protein [Anaeroplasmataceae bacterium]
MKLEDKIRSIREKEGLSQEKFANKLMVSRQTVINWESGKNIPETSLLIQIANEFHINLTSLVNEEQELSYLSNEESKNDISKPDFIIVDQVDANPLYICKKRIFNLTSLLFFWLSIILLFSICSIIWVIILIEYFIFKIFFSFFILTFAVYVVYFSGTLIHNMVVRGFTKIYFYNFYYIVQKGIKKKNFKKIAFANVQEIEVEQTYLEKILGYGKVQMNTSSKKYSFSNVKKPDALKKFMIKT